MGGRCPSAAPESTRGHFAPVEGRRRLRGRWARLGAADLSELGRLVGHPRGAAERQDLRPLGPCRDLALGLRADAERHLGLEMDGLAFDVEVGGAFEYKVDLL